MSKYVYEVYNIKQEYVLSQMSESSTTVFEMQSGGYTYVFDKDKGVFVRDNYMSMHHAVGKYFRGSKSISETPLTATSAWFITGAVKKGGGGGGGTSYEITFKLTFIKESKSKSTLKETVTAEEGTYPDNGIQGDYWYIKVKKAIPTIRIDERTVSAIKYKDRTGKIREISSVRYKDSEGNIRNLK